MTEERKKKLLAGVHDEIICLKTNIKCGKLIPTLESFLTMYMLMEEILETCPVEAG